MDIPKNRDGPGSRNGSQGRIGPLTSTPGDQRPPQRDLACIDDTESPACQQTPEDRGGLPAPLNGGEKVPSLKHVRPAAGSGPSEESGKETDDHETCESPSGSVPVVWETPSRQEGRFSVQVKVVCLPDGGERAECLRLLAFGGDLPPWRKTGDPGC